MVIQQNYVIRKLQHKAMCTEAILISYLKQIFFVFKEFILSRLHFIA